MTENFENDPILIPEVFAELFDKFLEDVNAITDKIKEDFVPVMEYIIEDIRTLYCGDLPPTTEKLTNKINEETQKKETFIQNYEADRKHVEKVKDDLAKLKTTNQAKKKELAALKMEMQEVEEKLAKMQEENKKLKIKKDEVFVHKVLTKVEFDYSSKKVVGYVNKKTIECFSFNPNQDCSEELWKLVLKR